MSESNKHIDLFTKSGCLTTEALKGHISESLSDLEKDRVQNHLDSCELCSDALEGLQLISDPNKVDTIVSEIKKNLKKTLPDSGTTQSTKFKKQTRLYYYAVAASIVILMGFYFYLQNNFNNESAVQSVSQVVELEEKSIPPMPRTKVEETDIQPDDISQQNTKEVEPIQKERSKDQIRKEKKNQVAEIEKSIEKDQPDEDITYVPPLNAVRTLEDIPKSLGNQERLTGIAENAEPEEYVAMDIASTQPIEYYIGGVIVYDRAYKQAEQTVYSTKSNAVSGSSASSKRMEKKPQMVMSASKNEKGREQSEDKLSVQQNDFENESELKDESHFFSLGNEVPQYPGGYEALIEYLISHLNYPKDAKEQGLQGQVVISFVIEENGEVSSAKIIKGIGGGCDEEALRVIELMPDWQPAYKDGSPIRVLFNMPITFKLN